MGGWPLLWVIHPLQVRQQWCGLRLWSCCKTGLRPIEFGLGLVLILWTRSCRWHEWLCFAHCLSVQYFRSIFPLLTYGTVAVANESPDNTAETNIKRPRLSLFSSYVPAPALAIYSSLHLCLPLSLVTLTPSIPSVCMQNLQTLCRQLIFIIKSSELLMKSCAKFDFFYSSTFNV